MEAIPLATQTNPRQAGPETVHDEAAPPILKFRRDRPAGARITVRQARHRWYPGAKAVADFVLAAVALVPALPLMLLAALAVKLTSRGPAFYSQARLGKGGRPFTIFKLRTMIHNCESLTGPRWSIPGDPRITPVGWFLRRTHLDELPQLFNVLMGDMSLIGPRPERPEFVPELERALPTYRQRLNVRPGVTGLAQVQLPPDTDLVSVRQKLALDLYYVRHLSPWLDLRLLASTSFYAAGVPFRLFGRLLGIPASAKVERAMQDVLPEPAPLRARLSA
jgi:lipopolysaccharide/colanic/teichoic acid biosynthesis glycosyltransferase